MLSASERDELNQLRKSAHRFMTSPLEQACFELQSILDRSESTRLDSIMPQSAFRVLAKAVLLIKQEINK